MQKITLAMVGGRIKMLSQNDRNMIFMIIVHLCVIISYVLLMCAHVQMCVQICHWLQLTVDEGCRQHPPVPRSKQAHKQVTGAPSSPRAQRTKDHVPETETVRYPTQTGRVQRTRPPARGGPQRDKKPPLAQLKATNPTVPTDF